MNTPSKTFTADRARALAADTWGLEATVVELSGWADRNYLLRTDANEAFVLKVSPPGVAREVLENQTAAMRHLASTELGPLVPRIVPTPDGHDLGSCEDASGNLRWIRVVTYLEGRPIAEVDHREPTVGAEIGRTLARIALALADFDHPATRRTHEWDLLATGTLAHLARYIDTPGRRAVVEDHLRRFSETVIPRIGELERGVIHGDANDHNLLVDDSGRLAGLIDFGDLLHTAVIADLAINLAYLTLDRDDPVGDATHIIRAYHSIRPISALECELLPELVAARVVCSVLHSAHGLHRDPDNHYLQISAPPMWRWLESLGTDGTSPLIRAVEAACP